MQSSAGKLEALLLAVAFSRGVGRRYQITVCLLGVYHLDYLHEKSASIRSTQGIAGLVGNGARPVRDTIVRGVQERLDRDTGGVDLTREHDYGADQPVRITSAPFAGHDALFLARSGEERVIVLLDIMQQARRLKLPEQTIASA